MDHRSLTQSISVNAAPHTVWQLITRIDTIATWFDSWDSVETDSADSFLRLGTSFRLLRDRDHSTSAHCIVTDVAEPSRLQWTQITPDRRTTSVTFDLVSHPAEGTTEIRHTRTGMNRADPSVTTTDRTTPKEGRS